MLLLFYVFLVISPFFYWISNWLIMREREREKLKMARSKRKKNQIKVSDETRHRNVATKETYGISQL